MAVYVDDVLSRDPSWGIVGASLRRSDTRDALAPQDFLYTLLVRDTEESSCRLIGSIIDVLWVERQRRELLAAMVTPRTRIVSLTVTEKGYCHDPSSGALNPRHPDVLHDLEHPEAPVSAPALIVRALELRREASLPPFTVLSCDNLPANGHTTRQVTVDFAALRSQRLAEHIARDVAFPSTMVDRIVPATTEDDRQAVRTQACWEDAWPVVTEAFTQWVIEDRFSSGRPAFERAGAQLVQDVRPFELIKLRMLNGSHSTLAYLGYLAGYEYVSDAMDNLGFRRLMFDLMTREVIPTVPAGVMDLSAYRDALLRRFANRALKHRTWQIAMDGSQKLPQRLIGTIRANLAAARPIVRAALGVAAWMRYVTGIDEKGSVIDIRDPLADRLRAAADTAKGSAEALVESLLNLREVFGDDLRRNDQFRAVLVAHLNSLLRQGARKTVERLSQ